MENIRYEVWLQNQDKFVTQCTIVLIQKISGDFNNAIDVNILQN